MNISVQTYLLKKKHQKQKKIDIQATAQMKINVYLILDEMHTNASAYMQLRAFVHDIINICLHKDTLAHNSSVRKIYINR